MKPRPRRRRPGTQSTLGQGPTVPRSSAWGRARRPGLSMDSRNPTGFPGGAARQLRRRDHPSSPGSRDLISPKPRRVLQVAVKPHKLRNRHHRVRSRKLGELLSSMAGGGGAGPPGRRREGAVAAAAAAGWGGGCGDLTPEPPPSCPSPAVASDLVSQRQVPSCPICRFLT